MKCFYQNIKYINNYKASRFGMNVNELQHDNPQSDGLSLLNNSVLLSQKSFYTDDLQLINRLFNS
jgi:hypothetical protein